MDIVTEQLAVAFSLSSDTCLDILAQYEPLADITSGDWHFRVVANARCEWSVDRDRHACATAEKHKQPVCKFDSVGLHEKAAP